VSPRPMVADLPARWTPDDAQDVLDALEASKLSIAEFARQEGIDPQRLYLWRRKLGSSRVAQPPAGTHLVELRVRQPSHGASLGIEVACPSGHVVRVRDSASVNALAAVLRAIEGASC
jgi:transposase-like protein